MIKYLKILRRHKHPLKFLLARILVVTRLCRFLTIQQNGYRIRFQPSNLSEQLWIDPHCRDDALSFFRDYLREGDKVIDVGANVGDTVLTSSRTVGLDGRVWAVEPHPRTFSFLKSNLELNHISNVYLLNFAAGKSDGEISFADGRRDDMNRIGEGELLVPIHRLDDQISINRQIALIKVDVEGFEKPALEGAERLLALADCIYCEVCAEHFSWYGYSIQDLLEYLETKEFKLYRTSSIDVVRPIDTLYEVRGTENIIGVKDISSFLSRTGWQLQP